MDRSGRDHGCLGAAYDVAWVAVDDHSAIGAARRVATTVAQRLDFPETRAAEVGIVVTEMASNLHKHADQGWLLIRTVLDEVGAAVEIVAVDSGPGMADPSTSFRDGSSTAGTLGIGLGAVRRLADTCRMVSEPGRGTVLSARLWPRRGLRRGGPEPVAGLTRALAGEDVCGDSHAARWAGDSLWLMLCDGAGHGALAASASQSAVRVFCAERPTSPDQVVRRIHEALSGSRGGAVAVAEVDTAASRVRFAGVGNVAGALVDVRGKRSMVSLPGIAGYQARSIKVFEYVLAADAAVVLHSDGLTERWTLNDRHALLAGDPLQIAAVVLREAGVRRDDASVLVAKAARP